MTYRDLRGIPEFADKTVLAIKAPPDTLLKCDVQEPEVSLRHSERLRTARIIRAFEGCCLAPSLSLSLSLSCAHKLITRTCTHTLWVLLCGLCGDMEKLIFNEPALKLLQRLVIRFHQLHSLREGGPMTTPISVDLCRAFTVAFFPLTSEAAVVLLQKNMNQVLSCLYGIEQCHSHTGHTNTSTHSIGACLATTTVCCSVLIEEEPCFLSYWFTIVTVVLDNSFNG